MNRIAEIDEELKSLNRRKRELLKERKRLTLYGATSDNPESSRFWAESILVIIRDHPGASRKKIAQELTKHQSGITDQQLTNSLTMLGRRGWIMNRGTRKFPEWYVVPQHVPETTALDHLITRLADPDPVDILDESYDDEGNYLVHGRCDTCGDPCDENGCTTDRSHVEWAF